MALARVHDPATSVRRAAARPLLSGMRFVSRAVRSWHVYEVVAVIVGIAVPARAGRLTQRISLRLVEYSVPGLARRGTLTEFVYSGKPDPPYGYGYQVRLKVNGICHRPSVQLAGGKARGWVQSYDYGSPGYFTEDLYADAVAVVPYGTSATDGSSGIDTLCGGYREARTGTLYVYRRASDYVWLDNGFYQVADVLVCSDQLGCNWFAGYHRRPDIMGTAALTR